MADVALPKTNQTGTNEWADVQDNDDRLLGVINKDYDSPLAEVVGMSIDSGSTRRDSATVATEESTASTTWADLTTPGPSVTLTIPSNGLVLVAVTAQLLITGGSNAHIGVHAATDYSLANDTEDATSGSVGTGEILISTSRSTYNTNAFHALTILPATAGSRTYTMKYKSSGAGTLTAQNRKLWVVALGGF